MSKRNNGAAKSTPRLADIGRARSGAHTSPVVKFVLNEQARDLIDQAAEAQLENRSEWIRGTLAVAAAQQLGMDEAETVSLFDKD